MAHKNPLRENTHPQEALGPDEILGTNDQQVTKITMATGEEICVVTGETLSKMGKDGVYQNVDVTTTHLGPDGVPLMFSSGFLRQSYTGQLITSPEQWAVCTSRFHRHANRNVFVGLDGSSFGNGEGICAECQRILTTIYVVMTILGFGVLLGLYGALRSLY